MCDRLLLAFATRLLHGLQRTVGPTSYWVAEQVLILLGVRMALEGVNYWVPILERPSLGAIEIVMFTVCGVSLAISLRTARAAERLFRRTGALTSPDVYPMRLASPWGRTLVLAFLVVCLPRDLSELTVNPFEWVPDLLNVQLLFSYVILVPPLPPTESKVRRFLRTFARAPRLVPAEGRAS